jgi:hypothetical protein
MANICLKLQNKQFYFRVPESPAQVEFICVKKNSSIISPLGTFKKKKNSKKFILRRLSQHQVITISSISRACTYKNPKKFHVHEPLMVDTWAKNLASASRRMSAAVFFTIVVRTVASSRTPDT